MASVKTDAPIPVQLDKLDGPSDSNVREDTFHVDKPVKKENTFTVDSTEKTREKTKALEERRRSQMNSTLDSNSLKEKMGDGENKNEKTNVLNEEKKDNDISPGSDVKEATASDVVKSQGGDRDNDKGKEEGRSTRDEKHDTKATDDKPEPKTNEATKGNAEEDMNKSSDQQADKNNKGEQNSSAETAVNNKNEPQSGKSHSSVTLKADKNASTDNRGSTTSVKAEAEGEKKKDAPSKTTDDTEKNQTPSGRAVGEKKDDSTAERDQSKPDEVKENVNPPGSDAKTNQGKGEEHNSGTNPSDVRTASPDSKKSDLVKKNGEPSNESDVAKEAEAANKKGEDLEETKDKGEVVDEKQADGEKTKNGNVDVQDDRQSGENGVKDKNDVVDQTNDYETDNKKSDKDNGDEENKKMYGQESKPNKSDELPQVSDNLNDVSGVDKVESAPEGAPSKAEESGSTARQQVDEQNKNTDKIAEERNEGKSDSKNDSSINESKEAEKSKPSNTSDSKGKERDVPQHPSSKPLLSDGEETKQKKTLNSKGKEERNVPNHPSSKPVLSDGDETKQKKDTVVKSQEPKKTLNSKDKDEQNVPNPPPSKPRDGDKTKQKKATVAKSQEPTPKKGRNKDYPGKPIRVKDPPKSKSGDDQTPRKGAKQTTDSDSESPRKATRFESEYSDSDTPRYIDMGSKRPAKKRTPEPRTMGRSSKMGQSHRSKHRVRTPTDDRTSYPPEREINEKYGHARRSRGYHYKSPRAENYDTGDSPSPASQLYDEANEMSNSYDDNSGVLEDLENDTKNILDVIRTMQEENKRAIADNKKLRQRNNQMHRKVEQLNDDLQEVTAQKDALDEKLQRDHGRTDTYVRKLEKDLLFAEQEKQKYIAKARISEEEKRKHLRRAEDKDVEIGVAISELKHVQTENERLVAEMIQMSSGAHKKGHATVTEVSDKSTQTFSISTLTEENEAMTDILKEEVASLKDYNKHLQKSLREEMSRRELVQSLLDDVMSTNEGFRQHMMKLQTNDSDVNSLTQQLREMEAAQRKLLVENTQLRAAVTLLEGQAVANDHVVPAIVTDRSSKKERNMNKRYEELERKLKESEARVSDLEGYLDEIFNNDDVKIIIKSDPRSNVTSSLPELGLPSLLPERRQAKAFKLDLNAYNSYKRIAKHKANLLRKF